MSVIEEKLEMLSQYMAKLYFVDRDYEKLSIYLDEKNHMDWNWKK